LRDLGDAHLAIELLRATLSVVEREGDAEEYKDLRSTLAQMQLGYVQAVRSDGERGAAAVEQSASASGEPDPAPARAAPDASAAEAAPDSE
jgi:hypothetical protein